MDVRARARELRAIIESAVQSTQTDGEALKSKELYPTWESLIGSSCEVGKRLRYGDDLYKVRQAHTAAEERKPGEGTESLYARIDTEHSGTADDPIPYKTGLEIYKDLYYTEDGKKYLCVRDSGAPLYHHLSDLIGLYVEEV